MRLHVALITKEDVTASKSDIENAETIALTLNIWLTMLTDSPDISGMSPKAFKKATQWWKQLFIAVPYKDLVKSLDVFSHTLQKEMQWVDGRPSIGQFLPGMMKLPIIGKVYHEWYKASISEDGKLNDGNRLKYIISFFKFGKKAVLDDPSLKDIALREVIADENDLSVLRFPNRLIDHLNMVYHALFPSFVDESLHLKHGNGYVAEGVNGIFDKVMLTNEVSYKMLKKYYFKNPDGMSICRNANGYGLNALRRVFNEAEFVPDWSLITEGEVVAKDANNVRFIGHEPASKMVLQQAVFWMFNKTFKTTHVSRSIDLSDQSRSKAATLVASMNGRSSTIDLSRASNRLAWKLIRKIVPRSILEHLDASRTQNLRVGDQVVHLQMASTMGSAITFPLQTSVFYAITVLSMLYHYHLVLMKHPKKAAAAIPRMTCASEEPWNDIGFENYLPIHTPDSLEKWLKTHTIKSEFNRGRHYDTPLVYGDDIICPTQCVDILYALLDKLGLVVNRNKSFTKSDGVRESCGAFCAFGIDYTPVVFKTPHYKGIMTIETLHSLVGLANRLSEAAIFSRTREYVVRMILKGDYAANIPRHNAVNSVMFTHDPTDNSKVYTTTPDINWHLERRSWLDESAHLRDSLGFDFQLDEMRGFSVVPIYNDDFVSPPKDGEPLPPLKSKRKLKLMKVARLDLVDSYRYAQANRLTSKKFETSAEYKAYTLKQAADDAWQHGEDVAGSAAKIDFRRPSSYAIEVRWTPLRTA